jgi:hypothetical protein
VDVAMHQGAEYDAVRILQARAILVYLAPRAVAACQKERGKRGGLEGG